MTPMLSTPTKAHQFYSLFAAQAFIATLKAAKKPFRLIRSPRPKVGKPLYMVFVYG